jgi:hypothetical protein
MARVFQVFLKLFFKEFMPHVLDITLNMEVKIKIFILKLRLKFYLIDTRKRLIGLHGILVGCGEILGKTKKISIKMIFVFIRRRFIWIYYKTKNSITKSVNGFDWFYFTDDFLLFCIC